MTFQALAFDAYGTLFDVHSAMARLRDAIGPDAEAFSALWRVKQLEYTWTRTLAGRYRHFEALTGEALDFCLKRYPSVDPGLRPRLMEAYRSLDAFPDVVPALDRLKRAGTRMVIFTNGSPAMVESAANSAGISGFFETIVSVHPLGKFKTAPETYGLVQKALGLPPGAVALVSSNRWDIAGAAAAGMPGLWINRTGQPDEYHDLAPARVLASISELI